MTRTQVALLEQLLDSAYRGDTAHALLANLADVPDAAWGVRPRGGDRAIAGIVEHCVIAKELWCDTLVGGDQRTYQALLRERRRGPRALDPAHLREDLALAHERFVAAVRSIDDAQLAAGRRTHYDAPTTVGRAIIVMIEHDHYHAGEINHLRALLQSDDRWPRDLTGTR